MFQALENSPLNNSTVDAVGDKAISVSLPTDFYDEPDYKHPGKKFTKHTDRIRLTLIKVLAMDYGITTEPTVQIDRRFCRKILVTYKKCASKAHKRAPGVKHAQNLFNRLFNTISCKTLKAAALELGISATTIRCMLGRALRPPGFADEFFASDGPHIVFELIREAKNEVIPAVVIDETARSVLYEHMRAWERKCREEMERRAWERECLEKRDCPRGDSRVNSLKPSQDCGLLVLDGE